MELAPNYTGTLVGISNTLGNLLGIVAPYLAGMITNGDVSFSRKSVRYMIEQPIHL